jgi:uncharacterized protein YuzE
MKISYDDKTDLLYLRFDEHQQEIVNQRLTEDIVLDIGTGGKIVGIEIQDASMHIDLKGLLPVAYEVPKAG